MWLQYKGVRTFTMQMPWLVGGPYTITGQGCVVEVHDGDGPKILTDNPFGFVEVAAPELPKPKRPPFVCEHCGKEYVSQRGLLNHIASIHADGGADADERGTED